MPSREPVSGKPDPDHISTSYVERANLTMRMHMRRFTRLTNAFSKKAENHAHAVAINFMYYNFVRIHSTLRMPTPAMAAKVDGQALGAFRHGTGDRGVGTCGGMIICLVATRILPLVSLGMRRIEGRRQPVSRGMDVYRWQVALLVRVD